MAFIPPLPVHRATSPSAACAHPPRRCHVTMSAVQPRVVENNTTVGNGADSVYCYVATSATKSDYLELVLTSRVYDVVSETPLEQAPLLSDRLKNNILLKREDTTDVKSFKVRGAYNMIAKADPATLSNGVVAASAGNHAQGVALAAAQLGIHATIVMPAVTPQIKVDAVKRRGAHAVLHGDAFDEAQQRALEIADKSGALFVPPFDHPDIIAGQGTVGLELLRQSSSFDAVFVPVGGGGLIAGIATVLKRLRPNVRVIGVEPVEANAMFRSLAAGERVRLDSVGTFADGVAVKEVGEETFRLCKDLVDEVILVDTDEICAAMKDVFEDTRSILEPAGALAVAGVKAYAQRRGITGEKLVAITSGANTNFDRLRHVSERAEIGEGREAVLAVTIPEHPGAFWDLICVLGPDLNFTEFNYRNNGKKEAHVFVGATVCARHGAEAIIKRLADGGYEAVDLTENELAKLHVRHLVGGFNGNAKAGEEALYRFEFPERPGALRKFLSKIPKGFDITLFHYRNHGASIGRVLVGLVALDGNWSELEGFVKSLGYTFVREDENIAYKFFLSR